MRLLDRPIVIIGHNQEILNQQHLDDLHLSGDPIFVYFDGLNHYDAFVVTEGANAKEILGRLLLTQRQHVEVGTIETSSSISSASSSSSSS